MIVHEEKKKKHQTLLSNKKGSDLNVFSSGSLKLSLIEDERQHFKCVQHFKTFYTESHKKYCSSNAACVWNLHNVSEIFLVHKLVTRKQSTWAHTSSYDPFTVHTDNNYNVLLHTAHHLCNG